MLVLISLRILHSRLLAVTLDRLTARSTGADPARVDLALLVLIALATLVAVQAVGNIFVVATLVAPAAAARPLARRIGPMMAIAVTIGVIAGLAGLAASYFWDIAAGASIAAFDVAIYALVRASCAIRSAPIAT
jgi:ABC-type Mn2+/Zn2+ transport system permease subunit